MKQTEKEKAENLINKFGKELAPKVVCEITDYLGIIEQKETSDFAFGGSYNGDEYYDYWQKVNQEMLKIKTNNMENETYWRRSR